MGLPLLEGSQTPILGFQILTRVCLKHSNPNAHACPGPKRSYVRVLGLAAGVLAKVWRVPGRENICKGCQGAMLVEGIPRNTKWKIRKRRPKEPTKICRIPIQTGRVLCHPSNLSGLCPGSGVVRSGSKLGFWVGDIGPTSWGSQETLPPTGPAARPPRVPDTCLWYRTHHPQRQLMQKTGNTPKNDDDGFQLWE